MSGEARSLPMGGVAERETASSRRRLRRLDGGQVFAQVVLAIMVLAVGLPFLWLVFGSFKTYSDLVVNPWWPNPWTLDNFPTVWTETNVSVGLINSLIVAAARVFFALLTSVAMGYIFAKYRFPGRDVLFVALLATLMVPFAAILVPLYLTLADIHLTDTVVGLIVIALCSTFGTFLLRQTIQGISDEYIDAARMDGASEPWIVWHIIIPMTQAALAALAIFTFLVSWDDFLFPSVVLTSASSKTLPLAIAGLQGLFWARYELYCAGAMISILPILILYAFLQRHFIRGLTVGGLKG